MNRLRGTITGIETSGHLSLVDVDVGGDILSAIIIETPRTADYLRIGHEILLLFKETEVILAKGLSGGITLKNRLPCVVKSIARNTLLTEIELDYKGRELHAVLASRCAEKAGISAGDAALILVKVNEITLMKVNEHAV